MAQDYTSGDILLAHTADGKPIEVTGDTLAGSHSGSFPDGIDAGGTSNLDDAAFVGNVTIDGDLEIDSSGSGEEVLVTGNTEIRLGNDAAHQFIVRAVGSSGPAALFVDSGESTYAGAANPAINYTGVHMPHLPVYNNAGDATSDTNLDSGQLYLTGGQIHVKA